MTEQKLPQAPGKAYMGGYVARRKYAGYHSKDNDRIQAISSSMANMMSAAKNVPADKS